MSDTPHQDALAASDDPLAEISKRIDAAGATITDMRAILDEPSVQWETMTNVGNVPERLNAVQNNRWNWFTDYLNNMLAIMSMSIEAAQMEDTPELQRESALPGLKNARDNYEHRNSEFALLKTYLLEKLPESLGLTAESRDSVLSKLTKLEEQKNAVISGVDAYVETGTVPPIAQGRAGGA